MTPALQPHRDERLTLYEEKERENNYQITDLIAEHRDECMRRQISVGKKFMDRIEDLLETEDNPKYLGSLARTFSVVADSVAKASCFEHRPKPQQDEQQQVRVGLFVQCAPIRVSEKPAIDVEVLER